MIKRDCQELVHMQHQSIKYQAESHLNRARLLQVRESGYILCRLAMFSVELIIPTGKYIHWVYPQ